MNKEELKMVLVCIALAIVALNAIFASTVFWLPFLR